MESEGCAEAHAEGGHGRQAGAVERCGQRDPQADRERGSGDTRRERGGGPGEGRREEGFGRPPRAPVSAQDLAVWAESLAEALD